MRKISRSRYFFAATITAGIFLLGLFLGLIIENHRLEFIQNEDTIQKLEYNSLQVLYAYIDQLSASQECDTIPKVYDLSLEHLENTRIRLENYDREAKIKEEEFAKLKREYVQAQLRYWLLAQKINEMCDLDIVSVLYFFSTDKECPDCEEQGFVLTYLKDIFKTKLLIFAIDSNYEEEPMIGLLKRSYNITKYPTIVIEENKYEGFTKKDEILDEVCSRYASNDSKCTN